MIGKNLGPYAIVAKIGAGGMGDVYRATDPRLGRDVAIKVLPRDASRDRARFERFEREARALAALNHPGIVTIHEIGESEQDGEAVRYLVMELVQGSALDAVIPDAGLTLDRLFEIAIPMCEAVAVAHERGIVHRDLKPANVMITEDGRVKVLDFGLAKLVSEDTEAEAATLAMTREGTVMGTVPYMSPEQVEGRPLDARSDVFSLGIVLYEMITGVRPFSGDTSPALMSSILKDTPTSVSDLKIGSPTQLGRILRRCLEKDPRRRYQSARGLLTELEDLRDEVRLEQSSAAATPARSARESFGGRRLGVIAAASLIVVVVAGFGWILQHRKTERQTGGLSNEGEIHSVAVLPFDDSGGGEQARYLSDGLTESLIDHLSPLPELNVLARTTVFRYRDALDDPLAAGRDLKVGAILTGRVAIREQAVTIGIELVSVATGAQIWGHRYQRPLGDIFAIEEEIAQGVAEHLRLNLRAGDRQKLGKAPTDDVEAYQLYVQGRYEWNKRTHEGFQRALAFFQQAIERDPDFALAYVGVADCYFVGSGTILGIEADEAYSRGETALRRALELDDSLAEAHAALAGLYWDRDRDLVAGEQEFKKALDLNPGYASARQWYGELLAETGRFEDAYVQLNRAVELDPRSTIVQSTLGWAYLAADDYARAEKELRKALVLDPDNPDPQDALFNTLFALGRRDRETFDLLVKRDQSLVLPDPSTSERLRAAFDRGGWPAVWRVRLEIARRLKGTVGRLAEAESLTQLGNTSEALDSLERLQREKWPILVYVDMFTLLDPLHNDPRYKQLLRDIGIRS